MADRKNQSLTPPEISNVNVAPVNLSDTNLVTETSNVKIVTAPSGAENSDEEVQQESKEEEKVEKKEKWKLWLSENHRGSRKIRLANGMRFNLNRLDEEDQEAAKKKEDYPIKEVEMTDTQIQNLRTHYGFKAQRIGG